MNPKRMSNAPSMISSTPANHTQPTHPVTRVSLTEPTPFHRSRYCAAMARRITPSG